MTNPLATRPACTSAIASRKFTGGSLAALYNVRGFEYRAKGDLDRAIADFNEAIKLNPKCAAAYFNRGLARHAKGDKAGGDADIARARQIQPGIGQ